LPASEAPDVRPDLDTGSSDPSPVVQSETRARTTPAERGAPPGVGIAPLSRGCPSQNANEETESEVPPARPDFQLLLEGLIPNLNSENEDEPAHAGGGPEKKDCEKEQLKNPTRNPLGGIAKRSQPVKIPTLPRIHG
jgi:hypothetical protein